MLEIINSSIYTILITIFVINIVYVSLFTIRTVMVLKGFKFIAAGISIFESFIYIVGLGLVLDNLDNIINIVVYAIGYATGIMMGLIIEQKLALGYVVVNVTTAEKDKDLPNHFRNLGYGVTHGTSYGRDGERTTMQILTPRRYEKKLIETIKEIDERAFIVSYEPKNISGGFWTKTVRRKQVASYEPENVEEVLIELAEGDADEQAFKEGNNDDKKEI